MKPLSCDVGALGAPGRHTGARAVTHPTVYITPTDVERAKDNIARHGWAQDTLDAILLEADRWVTKDDPWLRGVVPSSGACFAYGFTGCPICGRSWGNPWLGIQASFDNPNHVKCYNGHVLPDEQHPDSGTGYVAPDGRIHYFVGSYNAWVVETLTFQAADHLTYAYTLTSDERYAAKATLILDALAAIYPTCNEGSWDYPGPRSGRFNRNWYMASRVLVHYVDQYDQLYSSPSLEEPSVVPVPERTRRQNIEESLLKNAAAYCYEESLVGGLNNGVADYLRGVLAVGVCLDIPDYVRWPAEGPFGIDSLLENNIDRDGGYYETSALYADHTRGLYLTFAEPLFNYRGSAYPDGLDLYRRPKLRQFFLLHNLAQNCAGHTPSYGDADPDFRRSAAPLRPFNRNDYHFLERLYARTDDPAEQHRLAALLRWLAGGNVDQARASIGGPLGEGFAGLGRLLFHLRDVPEIDQPLPPEFARRLTGCDFLGQKGIGILRSGEGPEAQALLLRFGPSLNHGHRDDLNYNYCARGYELTYDLGYGLGSTHTQVGWASQTASHNVVVVDETSQMQTGATGGSLHLFADLPCIKVMEASSEASYAVRGWYRRTLALIGDPPTSYVLDLFRVRGGHQHDWFLHALGNTVALHGVTLGPERPGSLAGPHISWGDKQLNDGNMDGYPNQPYWNPPPGNGYGFLIRPSYGQPAEAWGADWPIDRSAWLRITMPASPDLEVITALAPGITPTQPKARYVVARRRGEDLASEFVATLEPYEMWPLIRKVGRLRVAEGKAPFPPVGVKIERLDGFTDYVFSSPDSRLRRIGQVRFAGRFAHARLSNGRLVALGLVGARQFAGFGWELILQQDGWSGVVSGLDVAGSTFTTSTPLPADGTLNGQMIVFSNPRYSRTTAYRIVRVEAAGAQRRVWLHASVVLGKGLVHSVCDPHTLLTVIPHEYGRSTPRVGDPGFFQGKRIRLSSGSGTHITGVRYGQPMRLEVESTQEFQYNDLFYYDDIQVGDQFWLSATLALTVHPFQHYQIRSTTPVRLSPFPAGLTRLD